MYLAALQVFFSSWVHMRSWAQEISRSRADLRGNCVPEKGPVVLNFCAADFLGEVLSLLGWCFLLAPHCAFRCCSSGAVFHGRFNRHCLPIIESISMFVFFSLVSIFRGLHPDFYFHFTSVFESQPN